MNKKKQKYIINAIPLLSPLTGIGRYTYETAKYIKDIPKYNVEFYYGYISKKIIEQPTMRARSKQLKSILTSNPLVKKILRKIIMMVGGFFSKKYDLYFEPNFIPLESIKAKKTVVAVHDFSFILYKDFHPKERIEYFEKYFFQNIKRANKIICFSNFTKQEILDKIEIDEKDIQVIYHSIDHNLFKVLKSLTINFELPKKFIFCAGSIEPRKNLIGLLRAYDLLSQDIKQIYKLVLAGFKGWQNNEIMQMIEKNKNYIVYLGYLSEDNLVKVYNLATLFVYPSFYEGFGLPPLEAMACGTPVITSNVSSLPEVGGDAVVYCDPFSVEDIKAKIEMVLNDEKLQQEMIQKGLIRAKEFTWEKSAKEHLRVFQEVLNS